MRRANTCVTFWGALPSVVAFCWAPSSYRRSGGHTIYKQELRSVARREAKCAPGHVHFVKSTPRPVHIQNGRVADVRRQDGEGRPGGCAPRQRELQRPTEAKAAVVQGIDRQHKSSLDDNEEFISIHEQNEDVKSHNAYKSLSVCLKSPRSPASAAADIVTLNASVAANGSQGHTLIH